MTFAARIDHARLAKVAFGDAWVALVDPADAGACDPFDVRARMAMYRLLVERASADHARSPFWGFASQLAWQQRSGRLGSDHAIDHTIDRASWWGACNYALSVIPYLAATELAIVPDLRLPRAPDYARAISAWRDAFRALQHDDQEPMRFAVWRAHLASIRIAVTWHRAAFDAMPADEQRFARGWVRMVDLFGAAALRTDLEQLAEHGAGDLPHRVLRDRDALADLTRAERSAVRRVIALGDRPAWRWSLELAAWRRIMRTAPARDEAMALIAALFGRHAWPARARALRYALVAK